MNGIIVFYMNFHPEHNQDPLQAIDLLRKVNQELFDKINKDGHYNVAIVPCTKEACRVEKIDFDKPFPRYASKTHVDLNEDEKRKLERERIRLENRKTGE
jgi:hypothetical protein